MTDSWERRHVAATPGYNTPAADQPFTLTYDGPNDRLVVTAVDPVFVEGTFDEAEADGENPVGTPWTQMLNGWTVNSPTEIELTTFRATWVGAGDDALITSLDLFNVGAVLLGSWVGSLLIEAPVAADVTDMQSPAAATIRLIGTNLDIGDTSFRLLEGAPAFDTTYYDSAGINAASNPPGATVTVTPTQVDIFDPALGGHEIEVVFVQDDTFATVDTYTENVVVAPLTDPWVTNVTAGNLVTPGAAPAITLDGYALDAAGAHWRVFDNSVFDSTYYDSAGPNAGLNPAGSTVTVVNANQVTIEDPALDGITVSQVQSRNAGNAVVNEWYGTAGPLLSYPTLTGICSPAPDTVRLTGTGFLTSSAGPVGYTVLRGDAAILGGPLAIYEFADGSPDANGWSLVTHTDTVIEVSNPAFDPGDTVDGVAFHDPTALTMYYYEPWGDPSPYSTLVDGSGC